MLLHLLKSNNNKGNKAVIPSFFRKERITSKKGGVSDLQQPLAAVYVANTSTFYTVFAVFWVEWKDPSPSMSRVFSFDLGSNAGVQHYETALRNNMKTSKKKKIQTYDC